MKIMVFYTLQKQLLFSNFSYGLLKTEGQISEKDLNTAVS